MMKTVYNISFPKLGINLKINPVAISFGSINVRWYGILISLGFLLAFFFGKVYNVNVIRNGVVKIN